MWRPQPSVVCHNKQNLQNPDLYFYDFWVFQRPLLLICRKPRDAVSLARSVFYHSPLRNLLVYVLTVSLTSVLHTSLLNNTVFSPLSQLMTSLRKLLLPTLCHQSKSVVPSSMILIIWCLHVLVTLPMLPPSSFYFSRL